MIETILDNLGTIIILGLVTGALSMGVMVEWKRSSWTKSHPCIHKKQETQYEPPTSIIVGGSKYGGGVSVPLGNMKPIQVMVCDQRQGTEKMESTWPF